MNCANCGAPLATGAGFCSRCGAAAAAVIPAAPGEQSGKPGVLKGLKIAGAASLLLFVIIAAFAIHALIAHTQRTRQKRMMGELKNLALAAESYHVDNHHYPPGSSIDELCKALSPDYAYTCMRQDIWSTEGHPHPFAYAAWGGAPERCPPLPDASAPAAQSAGAAGVVTGAGGCGPAHFALASAGNDGKWEAADFSGYDARDTDRFGADIVIMDAQFVRSPYDDQWNRPTHDAFDRPPGPPPESFVPPLQAAHQIPK